MDPQHLELPRLLKTWTVCLGNGIVVLDRVRQRVRVVLEYLLTSYQLEGGDRGKLGVDYAF